MDVKHSLTVATFFFSLPIFAATNSPSFVYQGRLLNASGTAPLSDNNLTLTFAIYDPSGNCLLYEETQTGIDTASTQGAFSLQVGSLVASGKRTANDPQLEMSKIFANAGTIRMPGSPDCAAGYNPAAGDVRKLRVTANPSAGGAITLSPDQTLTSVPQAVVADTLQGLEPMQFVQVTGNASSYQVGKTDLDLILGPSGAQDASSKHHHDSLYAKLSGSSTMTLSPGSLLGLGSRASDPTGLGVGDAGKTWFDSSAGAIKFFDGTSVRTLGLEGSGVQSLLAGVGISISGTTNSTIALDAGTQTTLSSVAGKLDANLPVGQIFVGNGAGSAEAVSVSGDVSLSAAGAATVNSVGGVTAANVASGANAANSATSANTANTVIKRDAGGNFSAGTITANVTGNVSGSASSFTGSLSGDVSGTQGATSVDKIKGRAVSGTPSSGQVLTWNNALSQWEPQTPASAPVTSVAGKTGAVALSSTDISGLGTAATKNVGTAAGTVAAGDDSRITGAVQSTGGTMSGALTVNNTVGAGGAVGASTQFQSTAGSATTVGAVVKGAASQSADLQQWQNSAGSTLSKVDSTGKLTVPNLAVSTGGGAGKVLTSDASGNATWQTPPTAPVTSVAGKTGAVTLSNTDISGLGTAATQNVGTGPNNVVQLNGSSQLPAVSGANLTNLPAANLSGRVSVSNLPAGTALNHGFPLTAQNGTDPAFQAVDLGSAAATGTLAAGRFPALTGAVTTTAGSLSTTLSAGAVSNSHIAAGASIVDTKLATISTAGKVSNSATTATSANTANAIVARDPSGNFSAGTITAASVTGLNAPANTTDAATKEYVDAAGGSSGFSISCVQNYGSGNSAMCVRINHATGAAECSKTGDWGSSWNSCSNSPFSSGNPDIPSGYFVLTYNAYDGNLGGLSGANSKCLQELTSYPWKGKAEAESRGIVTASNVRAFLCDAATCNAGEPFTSYVFAQVGAVTVGGGSFVTDINGLGPNDGSSWSNSPQFNSAVTYWTGRGSGNASQWTNTPAGSTCSSWTTTSGNGQYGVANNSDTNRWSMNNVGCNNAYRLVCFVHP